MTVRNAIASVAVKDLETAKTWYEKLLEQPCSMPMPGVAEWTFAGGGGLQVYELPERAGGGSVTLSVKDIEAIVRQLETLGIDTSQRTSSDRVKTVMIVDPEGNHIAFAQAIDLTLAH